MKFQMKLSNQSGGESKIVLRSVRWIRQICKLIQVGQQGILVVLTDKQRLRIL